MLVKKNKAIKKGVLIGLATATVGLCTVGFLSLGDMKDVEAEVSLKESISFQDSYVIGQTLEIPDTMMTINGEDCETYKVVYYPNGDVYKTDSIVFKDNGLYTLEYKAEKDGKLYTKTFEFDAEKTLYSVTSARSEAVYGTDLMLENYPEGTSTGIPGINVSLTEGDYFNYNQAIDLSDNDSLTPLLDLMYVPSKGPKTYDAQFIYITLTDAYNADNAVTIRLYTMNYDISDWETKAYRRDAKARVHVAAAANGQELKGVANSSVSTGNEGASIQTYNWAMTTDSRPYAEQEMLLGEESSIQLYYEYSTNCIYASGYITTVPKLIVDLDEMTYQDAMFEGFTTGEVLLSMYGGGYAASTLNTVITYLDGQPLDKDFSDVSKVEIFVDREKYGDGETVAALNKPFEIMPATAIDVYHQDVETKVSTRVYRNYYLDGASVDVPIVDGKFTPTKNTTYTIEYTVVGFNGESFKKTVDVKVQDFAETITVSGGEQSNGMSGTKIPVFSVMPIDVVGTATVDYTVCDEQNNEITVTDGYFKPTKAGVYAVTASITDYVGRKAEIFKTCTVSDGGILLDTIPTLNDYYFTNKEYVLPTVTAYDYTNQKATDVTVKVNGTQLENNTVTFTGETAVISYASGETELYTKTVQLINAIGGEWNTEFSFDKFFILSDGITATATENSVKILATENTEKATVDFVNPLYVDKFNAILSFAQSTFSGFDKISFYLTDTNNKDICLKVSFKTGDVSNEKYILYLNDNRYPYQQAALSPMDNGEYKLDISYSETFSTVTVENCFERSLKLLGYGDTFSGFDSTMFTLRIELENVMAGTEFNIKSICGQGISSNKYDYVSASVVVDGTYEAFIEYDQILNVHAACGIDVVTGVCEAYVTVKTPSGAKAVSVDGVKLDFVSAIDYEVLVEEYGYYLIEYTVYDGVGNHSQQYVSMVAVDRTPPTISVSFEKTDALLNESFTLPRATISDNNTSEDAVSGVYCIIEPPVGRKYILNPGDVIQFTMTGNYVIRYYGVDASGNSVKADFTVTVR